MDKILLIGSLLNIGQYTNAINHVQLGLYKNSEFKQNIEIISKKIANDNKPLTNFLTLGIITHKSLRNKEIKLNYLNLNVQMSKNNVIIGYKWLIF